MAEPPRKAAFVSAAEGAPLAWNGERLSYLIVGEQTAGRCAVSSRVVPPGGRCGLHLLHDIHTGYFVVSGELMFVAGHRHLIVPADVNWRRQEGDPG